MKMKKKKLTKSCDGSYMHTNSHVGICIENNFSEFNNKLSVYISLSVKRYIERGNRQIKQSYKD